MGGVLGEDGCSIGSHTFGAFVGMPLEKRIESSKKCFSIRRWPGFGSSNVVGSIIIEDGGSRKIFWLIEGHVISL